MDLAETATFCALLDPMDAELLELQAQVDQLAGTIQVKKDANAKVARKKDLQKYGKEERRIDTLRKQMGEVIRRQDRLFEFDVSLSEYTRYNILKIYIDLFGKRWTPAATALNALPRLGSEGYGEKGYRHMEGLSPIIPGASSTMDVPEREQEAKSFERHAELATEEMQSIRMGADALELVSAAKREIARICKNEDLTPEQWSFLDRGELGQETLSGFPPEPEQLLVNATKPSTTMAAYKGGLICAFSYGYFVVPHSEFDQAFSLKGISQGGPCYNLDVFNYLAGKIQATLPAPVTATEEKARLATHVETNKAA